VLECPSGDHQSRSDGRTIRIGQLCMGETCQTLKW
jgi:hypothetical protein